MRTELMFMCFSLTDGSRLCLLASCFLVHLTIAPMLLKIHNKLEVLRVRKLVVANPYANYTYKDGHLYLQRKDKKYFLVAKDIDCLSQKKENDALNEYHKTEAEQL